MTRFDSCYFPTEDVQELQARARALGIANWRDLVRQILYADLGKPVPARDIAPAKFTKSSLVIAKLLREKGPLSIGQLAMSSGMLTVTTAASMNRMMQQEYAEVVGETPSDRGPASRLFQLTKLGQIQLNEVTEMRDIRRRKRIRESTEAARIEAEQYADAIDDGWNAYRVARRAEMTAELDRELKQKHFDEKIFRQDLKIVLDILEFYTKKPEDWAMKQLKLADQEIRGGAGSFEAMTKQLAPMACRAMGRNPDEIEDLTVAELSTMRSADEYQREIEEERKAKVSQ